VVNLSGFLTVGEEADMLAVGMETMRQWDRVGEMMLGCQQESNILPYLEDDLDRIVRENHGLLRLLRERSSM